MDNKHPGIFSVIKDTILPRSTVDEFTINIETFQNKVGTQARVVGISAIDLQILTLIYEIKAWDIAFFSPWARLQQSGGVYNLQAARNIQMALSCHK